MSNNFYCNISLKAVICEVHRFRLVASPLAGFDSLSRISLIVYMLQKGLGMSMQSNANLLLQKSVYWDMFRRIIKGFGLILKVEAIMWFILLLIAALIQIATLLF